MLMGDVDIIIISGWMEIEDSRSRDDDWRALG